MSAAVCECLAAWVDSEPCTCNESIGAPMEVSAKKLADANRLVGHIRSIDYAMADIAKHKHNCSASINYNHEASRLNVSLPPDIALGLLRTLRFQTLLKLSQTGVTSTATGYRPVVSA